MLSSNEFISIEMCQRIKKLECGGGRKSEIFEKTFMPSRIDATQKIEFHKQILRMWNGSRQKIYYHHNFFISSQIILVHWLAVQTDFVSVYS